MDIDWTQPYVLIFEWGLFILGWLLVVVLGLFALAVVYALAKALVMTMFGKTPPKKESQPIKNKISEQPRDIIGKWKV